MAVHVAPAEDEIAPVLQPSAPTGGNRMHMTTALKLAWTLAGTLALSPPAVQAGDPPALGGVAFDVLPFPAPSNSALGDVDNDGDIDVIAQHSFVISRATLSRSDGNGLLAAPVEVAQFGGVSAFTAPNRTELSDVNGDGNLDLLALPMSVWLGDGTGLFAPPLFIDWQSFMDQPLTSRTGDIDGDGLLDLVLSGLTTTAGGSTVSVQAYAGQGDGTYLPLPPQPALSLSGMPQFELFDVDHDGALDIVGSNLALGTMAALHGVGDGTFLPAVSLVALPATAGLPTAFADLNADGWVDVLLGSELNPQLWVGLGGPSGDFTLLPPVPLPIPVDTSPTALVTGDFDGDGHLDVASSTFGVGGVWLHTGDGTGALSLVGEMRPGDWTFGLSVADLGNDGRDDVVACSWAGDDIIVLHGATDSFVDIGFGGGSLTLTGAGSTMPNALSTLSIAGAAGQPVAYLSALNPGFLAFADGVLLPSTTGLLKITPADAPLAFRWPGDIPAGTQVLVQAASGGRVSNALAVVAR